MNPQEIHNTVEKPMEDDQRLLFLLEEIARNLKTGNDLQRRIAEALEWRNTKDALIPPQ